MTLITNTAKEQSSITAPTTTPANCQQLSKTQIAQTSKMKKKQLHTTINNQQDKNNVQNNTASANSDSEPPLANSIANPLSQTSQTTNIITPPSQLPRRCSWRSSPKQLLANSQKQLKNSQPVSGLVIPTRISSIGTKSLAPNKDTRRSASSYSAPPTSRIVINNQHHQATNIKCNINKQTMNNNNSFGSSSSIVSPSRALSLIKDQTQKSPSPHIRQQYDTSTPTISPLIQPPTTIPQPLNAGNNTQVIKTTLSYSGSPQVMYPSVQPNQVSMDQHQQLQHHHHHRQRSDNSQPVIASNYQQYANSSYHNNSSPSSYLDQCKSAQMNHNNNIINGNSIGSNSSSSSNHNNNNNNPFIDHDGPHYKSPSHYQRNLSTTTTATNYLENHNTHNLMTSQNHQLQHISYHPIIWDNNKSSRTTTYTNNQQQQQQHLKDISPTYSNSGYILATTPSGTIVGAGGGHDLAEAAMGSPPKSLPVVTLLQQNNIYQTSSSPYNSNYNSYSPYQTTNSSPTSSPSLSNSSYQNSFNNHRHRSRSPSLISTTTTATGSTDQHAWYPQLRNSGQPDDKPNYQNASLAAAIRRSNSLKAGSCLDISQTGTSISLSTTATATATATTTNNPLLNRHHHLISSGASFNISGSRSGSSSRASSPPTTNNVQQTINTATFNNILNNSNDNDVAASNKAQSSSGQSNNINQMSGYNSHYHQPGSTKSGLSSMSLATLTMSEVKLQHELRKLQRELDIERDKNAALSSQLNINSGLMTAFEQSLGTLNNRLHQLTALTEKKDNEIETLKQKVQMYKRHHKSCHQQKQDDHTTTRDNQDEQDDGLDISSDNDHIREEEKIQAASHDVIGSQQNQCHQSILMNATDNIIVSNSGDLSTASTTSSSSSFGSRNQDNTCDNSVQSSASLNTDDLISSEQQDSKTTISTSNNISAPNDSNVDSATSETMEKKLSLAQKRIQDLERQLRDKDRLLTERLLEALSAADQLEQLEASVSELKLMRRQEQEQKQKIQMNAEPIRRRSKTPDFMYNNSNLNGIGISTRHIKSLSPD